MKRPRKHMEPWKPADVYEANFGLEDDDAHLLDRVFLSEWTFDKQLQYPLSLAIASKTLRSPIQYKFPDRDIQLLEEIRRFHQRVEQLPMDMLRVSITEGSTPAIFNVLLLASEMNLGVVHYVSPAYFTLHKACEVLGLRLSRCNRSIPHDAETSGLSLPPRRSLLVVTDPMWCIGRHVSRHVLNVIKDWQTRTDSLVFVDGSFAYMDWNGLNAEPTASLAPERTIRVVCPTKSTCLHGIRFSYLIYPEEYHRSLRRLSITMCGASCVYSYLARRKVFRLMTRPTNPIVKFSMSRYEELRDVIDPLGIDHISPNTGFFMFAHLGEYLRRKAARQFFWLGPKHLDILGYEGWAKVNLLCQTPTWRALLQALTGK